MPTHAQLNTFIIPGHCYNTDQFSVKTLQSEGSHSLWVFVTLHCYQVIVVCLLMRYSRWTRWVVGKKLCGHVTLFFEWWSVCCCMCSNYLLECVFTVCVGAWHTADCAHVYATVRCYMHVALAAYPANDSRNEAYRGECEVSAAAVALLWLHTHRHIALYMKTWIFLCFCLSSFLDYLCFSLFPSLSLSLPMFLNEVVFAQACKRNEIWERINEVGREDRRWSERVMVEWTKGDVTVSEIKAIMFLDEQQH